MSDTTLITQVSGNIYATLQKVTPSDTVIDNFVQPLSFSLGNGNVGVAVASQIFSGQFVIPAGQSVPYDVTFRGTNDGVGNPLTITNVKTLFIANVSGTGTNSLYATGGPAVQISGTQVIYGDGGYVLYVAPGRYGMQLGPDTKHLTIVNPNAMDITYNLAVIGVNVLA